MTKVLFTISNVSVTQKDYRHLYANDRVPTKEMKKKKDWLIYLKKKIKKLSAKKAKIDSELSYFEYKILDQETYI